jgi:hypothetical protein
VMSGDGRRRRRAAAVIMAAIFPILIFAHSIPAARYAMEHDRPWIAAFIGVTTLIALALCVKVVRYLFRPPKIDR